MFTLPPTRFCVRTDLGKMVSIHLAASDQKAFSPVLLEGPGAVYRRLVGTGRRGDVVGSSISLEAALALGPAAGVVRAVRLHYVVFYEWVSRPAVNGEVAVALGLEGAAVVDCTVMRRLERRWVGGLVI
jgi:hypothetical protein